MPSPLPRNSPVPIAPPKAIIVMRRELSVRRKPRSRSMMSPKPPALVTGAHCRGRAAEGRHDTDLPARTRLRHAALPTHATTRTGAILARQQCALMDVAARRDHGKHPWYARGGLSAE